MEEQPRTVSWWRALPLGFRVLVGLLAFRLLAWIAAVAAALHYSSTEPAELSRLIWKLVGTAIPVPASVDATRFGKLTVIVGGSLIVHIIALLSLAARSRWPANVLLTMWVVVTIASDNPGVDSILLIPVWLLLVSPTTQRFLERQQTGDEIPSPPQTGLSCPERAKVCGYALLSGLVPGLGQLLHQRWRRAAAMFLPWTIAWVTHLEPAWMLIVLFAMSDAGWMTVESLRASRMPPSGGSTMSSPAPRKTNSQAVG